MVSDPSIRHTLEAMLAGAVRFDAPMAAYTAFGIGGPADVLAEPQTRAQLEQLVAWAASQGVPYMVVGQGTNLLVKDGGIRGLVIRLNRLAANIHWAMAASRIQVTAGMGLATKTLCALALRGGWQGMNFALGIPGHLGGAVIMNAGTHLGCMADVLAQVTLMTASGQWITLAKDQIDWGYRHCTLPGHLSGGAVLVEAQLVLTPGDRQALRAEAVKIMAKRTAHQPIGMPSAGSFFKNPAPDMPAGRLIDQAGLKGLTVGRAQVSAKHANFIVNLGGATAADVLRLKDRIQATVRQRFAVELIPEVRIVGEARDT